MAPQTHSARAKPGASGQGDFVHNEVRPKGEFKTFRTQDAGSGAWLLVASAAGGLIASLAYYLWHGNGIAYTPGTLLVIVSTGLLLAASLAMATRMSRPRLVNGFLLVATGLDVLGTLFAAWLLEASWLLTFMVLAIVGWIAHVAVDGRKPVAHARSHRLRESTR